MKSNIFIPEKINVGYQERSSTYTGKLAYIIYFDEKGVLRKETSWNSWRKEELGNDIYENVPTEGFVLNKKVGGYSTGWNHRQTYTRVYDPRGFEFEITVENLLYILENCSSIKGKGLEGEFVYSWDGKELVLLPVDSPDYKEIVAYNEKVHNSVKLKGKDLKLGGTYLTKDNQEWVYLGRYDKWEHDYDNKYQNENGKTVYPDITKGKTYYFFNKNNEYSWMSGIVEIKSLNKLISIVSEECDENYAEMFDKLERNTYYSPIDESKNEYLPYTYGEFEDKFKESSWGVSFYTSEGEDIQIKRESYGNSTENLSREKKVYYTKQGWGGNYTDWKWEKELIGNVQDVFDKYQPHYLNKYLRNGKLYSEGK